MNKLRIALALQLLVFLAWGGWLLASRSADSPEFYLETRPVDPRDLVSGTYVALNYDISNPAPENCRIVLGEPRSFFVKLEDRGRTAMTREGSVPVYEATDCAFEAGKEAGWVKADSTYRFGGYAASYGIERFYLNENDPRRNARSGAVIAKVKIGGGRRLALLDLAEKI
jgi:uncharacterized membrane-anchored protein